MIICETATLRVRHLKAEDAPFILELLNDAAFLLNIGDRNVRTLEEARKYIETGPVASYERYGFGLDRVELKASSVPIGLCGLLRRDSHPDVEIGFAFLPGFRGKGYGLEAASAVMQWGIHSLGLKRIVALTALENHSSIKLLGKLGFRLEKEIVRFTDRESKLFAFDDSCAALS